MTHANPNSSDGENVDLETLFVAHRERLHRVVAMRLNPRLRGRVDPADVVQEAFVEATRRFPDRDQA